jgi:hypothetical protein
VTLRPASGPAVPAGALRWRPLLAAGLLLVMAQEAAGLVFTLSPNTRTVYLQVGAGSVSMTTCWFFLSCPSPAVNGTVNTVSVAVPAAQLGNGMPQAMTSNSTTSVSPYNGAVVCSAPQQVYVAAYLQEPLFVNSGTATLRVTTPSFLSSGNRTLPFTQISWTRSNGTTASDIPAGSFSGGTQTLLTVNYNTWVENCLSFSYANSSVVAAGTYTGRATFTLTAL